MEVKIQIPDNCELIKDGDTYVVKEKKNDKPKTWDEFCEKYPIKSGESYIVISTDRIFTTDENYDGKRLSKTWCTSKEEAKAFLALMQLRQLRKAWVGDWEPDSDSTLIAIIYHVGRKEVTIDFTYNSPLFFPTEEMAEEFL